MNQVLLNLLYDYDLKSSGNGEIDGKICNWYQLELKPGVNLSFEHYEKSCEGTRRNVFEIGGFTNYLSDNLFKILINQCTTTKKCFGK